MPRPAPAIGRTIALLNFLTAHPDETFSLSELARGGLPILLISSDLTEMITLADRVLVMAGHRVRGEVDNDRDYERMSGRIIRIIHDRALSAVTAEKDAE